VPPPASVQLFCTCLVNELFPQVGVAAVEILESLGIRVGFPRDQTCCGQPLYNSGFWEEARRVARHNLDLLSRTQGPIIVPSGSCADMMVHQCPELFQGDEKWRSVAEEVAGRCHELSQFLVDVLHWSPATAASARQPGRRRKVAYHPSCHLLRGLGVKTQPLDLLKAVVGVELAAVDRSEECCGFGGMFSVKQPSISGAMLDQKCTALENSGADTLVSCDMGCLLHLQGGLRRRGSKIQVCHLAQLLNGDTGSGKQP